MSASLKYATTGGGAIALIVLALWPFLDAAARDGVLLAAAIAVPVQLLAFAMLVRYRDRLDGFMAAWVGGTFLRLLVIAVVAAVVIRADAEGAVPMLLALAGFFFALLMLEPVYLRSGSADRIEA